MIIHTNDLEEPLISYTKGYNVEVKNSYDVWDHVESYTLYQLKHFDEFKINDYK